MKRFWSSNLATLANQKSTTSSCIDNFRFCLSTNKNGRIVRFQQNTDHLSMGRAFLEWYPKFTPNIITIHFDFWTVSDKIATTVIIGFIVVKITQALIFILKLQI
jgi:hypothetical protein